MKNSFGSFPGALGGAAAGSADARLEAEVVKHVGSLVTQCDKDQLPMLASYMLDATIAVLIGAGVSREVALRWLEQAAPEAFDMAYEPAPAAARFELN